jgi:hypothetical protein
MVCFRRERPGNVRQRTKESRSVRASVGISGTPTVMLKETHDLRGVAFEAETNHQFAPPGGVYLMIKGPNILCRVSTGGPPGKLTRTAQCLGPARSHHRRR